MGVAERSRERVEAKLEELEEVYGSFSVNQKTISLPGEQYASMCERGNTRPVAAYIAVRNESEDVLHVERDGEPQLPGIHTELDEELAPGVRSAVEEQAGVECAIDGLDQVTITGLRNADDPGAGTLYHLVVVFSGTYGTGVPDDDAAWRGSTEAVEPVYA